MRWLRGTNSLAVRLIVTLTITSALVISAAGFVFYAALEAQLVAADREEIQSETAAVEKLIRDMPPAMQPYEFIQKMQAITAGHPRLMFGVKGRSGWLFSPDLKFRHALEQRGEMEDRKIAELSHDKGKSTWLVRKSTIDGAGTQSLQAVYLAVDTAVSLQTIHRYRSTALAITLLTTLLLGCLGYLVVRRGLAPLEHFAAQAEQITAEHLHTPLAVNDAPDEVKILGASINGMLARLNHSFSNLEQFAADIAHELRTPLNGLLQKTEIVLSRPRTSEEYEALHHANLEAFGKMKHMVADMLFLARADHGMLTLSRSTLDLAREVEKVAEFFEYVAADKRQSIEISGDGTIAADSLMVQQALTNLLSNAVKYGLPGSAIRIELRREDRHQLVAVSNATLPLDDDNLQSLFSRFSRGTEAVKRDIEGTGLGLAIVRSIMKVHEGAVEASTNGDTITVALRFPLRDGQ